VRARAIMAFEHCSSSVNPVVTDLVKNVVTPRFTDRRSAPQMLVKTPTVPHSVQSQRQSGLMITFCSSYACQQIQVILYLMLLLFNSLSDLFSGFRYPGNTQKPAKFFLVNLNKSLAGELYQSTSFPTACSDEKSEELSKAPNPQKTGFSKQGQGLILKAKDSKFVLEDTSRPRPRTTTLVSN